MNQRPQIPRRTQKMLWSESMGHCMNPQCRKDLFQDDTNIGELAHIEPNADGGDVSFDNLLVLCRHCHKTIDDNPQQWPRDVLSPNPPMDRDGWREDSGRGEGVTGAMIRARIRVDGRLAGGLQALLGAPMAAYSGCGERDGGIGHGKRRSRTGLARVCGDVGLAGVSVADGRRQAGSGMARSRARARLNCSSQGQRRGRCRVNRRAERVIRPARAKTRRLRVLVVTIF